MSAGDFVRNVRQVIDLLSKVAEVVPDNQTRKTVREAINAIDRDLVAASARLHDDAGDRTDENAD